MAIMTIEQAAEYAVKIGNNAIELGVRTFDDATVAAHPEQDLKGRFFAVFTVGETRYWYTGSDIAWAKRAAEHVYEQCQAGVALDPADWTDQAITPPRRPVNRFSF